MISVRTLRRHLMTGTVAAATAVTLALVGATPAQAQFSPCGILLPGPGNFMPPPCISFDAKKFADWATTHAQELEKITQSAAQLQQTVNATKTIGDQVKQLASVNIHMPTFDTSDVLGGLTASLKGTASGASLADYSSLIGKKMFAGDGSNVDAAAATRQTRAALSAEANVDAYGTGVEAGSESDKMIAASADLAKEVQSAGSLREDWAANSHVKTQLIAARTQQAYLLTTLLKSKSTQGVQYMPMAIANGVASGSMTSATMIANADDGMWDKVRQIQALYGQAQALLGSLQVVQMSSSMRTTAQGVIDDYNAAVARQAQLYNQMYTQAVSWTGHADHCNAQQVMDTLNGQLAAYDSAYAAERAQPIDSLGNAFAIRNIDAATMTTNEVDPRQFLGTWGDPQKTKDMTNITNGLLSGSLDPCVKGDGDNDMFRNAVLGTYGNGTYTQGYADVRLEVAWKSQFVQQAKDEIAQLDQTSADEAAQLGSGVSVDSATQQLKDMLSQANQLGSQVAAGTNDGAKTAAAAALAQFQTLIQTPDDQGHDGVGLGLPVVDVASYDTTPVVGGSVTSGNGFGGTVTTPVDDGTVDDGSIQRGKVIINGDGSITKIP